MHCTYLPTYDINTLKTEILSIALTELECSRSHTLNQTHLSLAMLIDVSTFLLGIGRSNEFFLNFDIT